MAMFLDWFDAPNYHAGATADIFYESVSSPGVTGLGTGRYGDTYSKTFDIAGSVVKAGLTASEWEIVGFSWRENLSSGPRSIMTTESGGGTDVLVWRYAGAGGACSVRLGVTGSEIATFPAYAATLEWVNTILAYRANGTVGELHVYKNGKLLSSQYDIQTKHASVVGNPEQLRMAGQSINITDIWRYAGTPDGSLTAEVPGDLFVWTGFAETNGHYVDFTFSGAGVTANYQAIDENATDEDTSFNQTSDVDVRDSFYFQNVPPDKVQDGTIVGVRVVAAMRFTDSGPHEADVFARHPISGTPVDTDGATKLLSNTYRLVESLWPTVPGTTTAWSIALIDDTEWGYHTVS
jgi:hypothetical protein